MLSNSVIDSLHLKGMYGLHLTGLRGISEYKNPEVLNPLLLSCCINTVHMNLSVVCSSVPATEG